MTTRPPPAPASLCWNPDGFPVKVRDDNQAAARTGIVMLEPGWLSGEGPG